jgi:isocitrate dehydrogenase kinase/phosphatase
VEPNSAEDVARIILAGFDKHYGMFRGAARDAKTLFERADWAGARSAAAARIRLYDDRVCEAVDVLGETYPELAYLESIWKEVKAAYIGLLHSHKRPECAETFYNSVARRVLRRPYYGNDYVFSRPAVSTEYLDGDEPSYRCYYPARGGLRTMLRQVFADFGLRNPFRDLKGDIAHVIRAFAGLVPRPLKLQPNAQLLVLSSLFFRNQAAYVVGMIVNGHQELPLVIPILQDDHGRLFLDALLLEREQIGAIFSLARAYFMVDMDAPCAYVAFLSRLMPGKPHADIYTSVGLQKQGKALLYRDLLGHLAHSSDEFVLAPGIKGMVMLVFTLPSFPYVFKVIRDWFEAPKVVDRKTVLEKYQLVKEHDRVGRLADTLEYKHVFFPVSRFSPALLAELSRLCAGSVEIDGDRLVVRHLFIERRMTPLDIALASADDAGKLALISEYGRALKELAGANIFPGDLLLKNFGVTRYGRVVFYDYDELCLLTDCRFRSVPRARSYDEEVSSEPWFSVGPNDVFPEELPTFIFASDSARRTFLEICPELVRPEFWAETQERIRQGGVENLLPYPESVRFRASRRIESDEE